VNYDEKNFIVKDSITGQSGNSAITFYVGKLDSSVGMVKKFWYNDRVKSCIFFRNGQKSGPQKLYDSTGKIMYDGFYLHDKRTGLSLYYYADSLISVEIYEDGVKLPLEPAQEDKIVTMLNH
jgi:antitoxin component YwqK of YwqJK toxin-antitoxin module